MDLAKKGMQYLDLGVIPTPGEFSTVRLNMSHNDDGLGLDLHFMKDDGSHDSMELLFTP